MRRLKARHVLVVWIVLFTAATAYAVGQNRMLIAENDNRVAEIQEARQSSCRQTYEGIREVFMPFFAPAAQRTAEQKADYRKFNATIDRRKARCDRQTSTGGTP